MKRDKIIISCLMILSFIITAISFLFVGDVIPIHYGITGEPDRYGSKYVMLIFPGLISIIGLTMLLICKYAKLTENYKKYTLSYFRRQTLCLKLSVSIWVQPIPA